MSFADAKGFFGCHWCNKKYKRKEKLEQHIGQNHLFAGFHHNLATLSISDRMFLLDQFANYSHMVRDIAERKDKLDIDNAINRYMNWDGKSPTDKEVIFVWTSHMLMPLDYVIVKDKPEELGDWYKNSISIIIPLEGNSVITYGLKHIVENHLAFCRNVIETGLLDKCLCNSQQLDSLFNEFALFLNLGLNWKQSNFVPTLIIDLIWHCAMMNPLTYTKLCWSFLGVLLPHCLEENEGKDEARIIEFKRHFMYRHRRETLKIQDLTLSSDRNAIEILRANLIVREEMEIERKKEEEERYRILRIKGEEAAAEARRIRDEAIANGTYVEEPFNREYSKC